jgi:3-deoxy-D-manno-octulosonate 8-phosphate phosphatase (KDO 8-P phosphatase)
MQEERSTLRKRGWKERAKRVRLLLLDVDGVMTDGRLGYDGAGKEFKFFHARDGIGIRLLQEAGVSVGILSGRKAKAVELRAHELGILLVYQNVGNKGRALEEILKRERLRPEQICYVGDDLVDLAALSKVGFAVTVANAVPEVKARVHKITRSAGGMGSVREICEEILKAQGKWEKIIQKYFGTAP